MTRGIAARLPNWRLVRPVIRGILGRRSLFWRFVRSPSLRYRAFGHPGDCVIYGLSLTRPDVFVVGIGSNDVGPGDALHSFLNQADWRGVLVEPGAEAFKRLAAAYGGSGHFVLENVAITSRRGSATLYKLVEQPGARDYYDQLASLCRELVQTHADLLSEGNARIESEVVKCMSFRGLCERHHIDRIDLIQIDAEGHDCEILKQIDFRRYRPSVVIYEHKWLSADDDSTARTLLRDARYRTIKDHFDTIAVSEEELANGILRTAWDCVSSQPGGPAD